MKDLDLDADAVDFISSAYLTLLNRADYFLIIIIIIFFFFLVGWVG